MTDNQEAVLADHSHPVYRPLMLAVRAADEAFEKAGDAGTKTWLDDYFLPELDEHGLTIVRKDAAPEPWRQALAALVDETKALREALKEAGINIASWAGYASDYFQEKWNLDGDLEAVDAALATRTAYDAAVDLLAANSEPKP